MKNARKTSLLGFLVLYWVLRESPESAEIAHSWSQIRFRLFASFFFSTPCVTAFCGPKNDDKLPLPLVFQPGQGGGSLQYTHIISENTTRLLREFAWDREESPKKNHITAWQQTMVHELSAFSFFPPLLVILVVESRPAPTSLSGSVSSGTGAEELLENYQRRYLH